MCKEKIRILYGVECFNAGVLRHVKHLCLDIDRYIFEIHLITSEYRNDSEASAAVDELRRSEIHIMLLPIKHNLSFAGDCRAIHEIVRYIRENNIAVVHSHSSKAGLLFRIAAMIANTRSVHTPHCYYFVANKGYKRLLYLFAERALSKITHKIILTGNETSVAIGNNVMSPDKIALIDNAVKGSDYRRYPRSKALDLLGIGNDKIIIGGVGRLSKQKNWEVFIMAAAKVAEMYDNVVFLIAGDGEQYDRLSCLIRTLGIEKRFLLLGYMEDVSMVYSCIDLFVSTSAWEGLPYTFLEARHFGINMAVSIETVSDRILDGNVSIYGHSNDCNKLTGALMEVMTQQNGGIAAPVVNSSADDGLPEFRSFIEKHEILYRKTAGMGV